MLRSGTNRLTALMLLHLLWGSVLWFSISKYGLGVSNDAVHMLFGGLRLVSGQGLTSYDGNFLVLWPPLYPAALGLVHMISGLPMLEAAAALQFAIFAGLSVCTSLLFLRIFPEDFGLAVLATVLADVGSVVLIGFGEVGSDYLHLLLVVLAIWLSGQYVATRSGRVYVALAVAGMLAAFTRYLGVAAIAASAATIMLLERDNLRKRVLNAAVLCLAAAPSLVWLATTSPLYARRAPITFGENFNWFSRSILGWFSTVEAAKPASNQQLAFLWAILLSLVVMVAASWRAEHARHARMDSMNESAPEPKQAHYLLPLLLYGLFYALALFGAASIAYFNKLAGRFLLPMYLPLVILPVAAARGILHWTHNKNRPAATLLISGGLVVGLLAMTIMLLRTTVPLVLASHDQGTTGGENAINTRAWHENAALRYWRDHLPGDPFVLLSNEPEGAAFYTQHAAQPAPRKTSGPYATEDLPLSSYAQRLFPSGQEVYLLWIEPNPYDYYYTVKELSEIATVEALAVDEDGGVYRLKPSETR